MSSLSEFLKSNDIRFHVNRKKISDARKEFNANRDRKSRVSAPMFREAVEANCNFWKVSRRKPVRASSTLNVEGWEKLRRTVVELLPFLGGVGILVAVEIVRTRVSCNAELLNGLNRDVRVW